MFDHLDDPEPFTASPALRSAARRRGRQLKRRRRAALGGAAVVVLAVAGIAGATAMVDQQLDQVDTVDVPTLRTTAEPGDPKVVLFVGADSDAGMDSPSPERSGPARADTILLARVDPGKERLTMLSIPRDLLVEIPGHGLQRINAAYAFGGPGLLVDTIDQNLGIEVDRYIETDFRGAAAVGDAVGGLSLSFPAPVRDRQTGLDLPAGCVELDGSQLLAVARSRHLQYFEEGRWKRDGTSDLGRMLRQQAIGVALLRQMTEVDLSNPLEVRHLLDATIREITVDSETTSDDLLALFRAIEGSEPVALRYPVTDLLHEGAAVLELGPGADRVTAAFLDVDEPQRPSAPTADGSTPAGDDRSTTTTITGDGSMDVAAPTTPTAAIPTPC
jgi:LCP family protein required for cell wall assembly